jgi:tRNA(Ile)-lysidine synthase
LAALDAVTTGLKERVAAHLLPHPPERLAVAVSGGGDSTALLYLLHELAQEYLFELSAVTVDHGLRPEAVREVAHVAARCAELRIEHHVLRWRDWDGSGNQQDAARRARYTLMTDWAKAQQVQTVALGHSLDDQAETVLMRLARCAGVDGLTAMVPRRIRSGVVWIRPLLESRRADLRTYLKQKGVRWCDDPSNTDARFDRIKAREALALLAPLGLTAEHLGQVAFNMARARDALDWQTFLEARKMVQVNAGAVVIDWRGYRTLPDEIARRMLVNALQWVSSAEYPPRRRAVFGVIDALKRAPTATLEGCMLRRVDDRLWIFREYQAVRDERAMPDVLWDGRWVLEHAGDIAGRIECAALGEAGLLACPDWRTTGLPRDLLLASPAVWSGDSLVAAPLAGKKNGWSARIANGEDAFFAALLSH